MSKALEERIKAIISGQHIDEAKKEKEELDDTETGKDEVGDETNDDKDSDDKDDKKSGKKDKAEVKESTVPGIGKSMTGVGKETSASEDNAKINKGKSNKLEADAKTITQSAKADSKDDNGDNERGDLKPGAAKQEKGGKLSANEHITVLFDGEQLSEEFKLKAETIFEAAVAQVAEDRVEALQEEYQQKLDEAVEAAKGELVEQIDGYLDYVVEKWIEDNAVALESGIKVELVDSFIGGMKQVFQEHYVNVPDEKVDVVEAQAQEIEALKEQIESLSEEKEVATKQATILQCESIIEESSKGLTAIESEKFGSLAENVEFETIEEFETKVKTIRESYFKATKPTQDVTKEGMVESKVGSQISSVLDALKKGEKMKF